MDEREEHHIQEARATREKWLTSARREYQGQLTLIRQLEEEFENVTSFFDCQIDDPLCTDMLAITERHTAARAEHHAQIKKLEAEAEKTKRLVTFWQEELDKVDLWEAAGGKSRL